MLRNPAIRFHLRANLKTMLTMYAIMITVYAALTLLFAMTIGEGAAVSIGGMGMATFICMLVVGTTIVNEDLPLLSSFGLSRKTQFKSALIATGITVLAIGIFETLGSLLLSLVLPYFSMFAQVEGALFALGEMSFSLAAGAAPVYTWSTALIQVLWLACLYALMFSTGFFFAAMFKFVPRKYKPFAIAGVIAFFVLLLPYLNTVTGNGVFRVIVLLFGEGPLRHALFFAGSAALLLGIGYLFFRRLQLYTVRK